MPVTYDAAVILPMRFVLGFLTFVVLLSFQTVYADVPKPEQKPVKPPALNVKPDEKPQSNSRLDMANRKYVFNADNLKSGGVIIPPDLPPIKSRLESPKMIGGVITPSVKPLVINVGETERTNNNKSFEDSVLVRYTNQQVEERTAGSRGQEIEIQRLPSQPRIKIKETRDRSPFKTAALPKAGEISSNDPVIIFFKERSSDLEVGQIAIIDTDIFNILKTRRGKKAAIYGFAEAGGNGKNINQLSLSRALLISEYLVDKGIEPDRIEARAMGSDTPISPKNRVDIVLFD